MAMRCDADAMSFLDSRPQMRCRCDAMYHEVRGDADAMPMCDGSDVVLSDAMPWRCDGNAICRDHTIGARLGNWTDDRKSRSTGLSAVGTWLGKSRQVG